MVTREQVIAEAARLGMTLSEEQITKYVTDGKLPEKPAPTEPPAPDGEIPDGMAVEEILQKYTHRQTVEQLKKVKAEAARRRIHERELETGQQTLTTQLETLRTEAGSVPGMREKLTQLNQTLEQIQAAEKARRKAKIDTLDEAIRGTFDYMLDPKTVSADKFDQSFEHIAGTRSPGSGARPPGEPDPWANKNPWKNGTPSFSIAEQSRITKTDPELARKLQAAAAQ